MSIKLKIEQIIQHALKPELLDITNESHLHGVSPGSESHFKIVVVSSQFEGQNLLTRHRAINQLIATQLALVRAIALHTFTPVEWEKRKLETLQSPGCVGGSKL